MKNDDVPVSDRVERRAHLDDGDVGQESKVFEGLQSFWVTQPLIVNISANIIMCHGIKSLAASCFNEIFLFCWNFLPGLLWAIWVVPSFSPQQLGFLPLIVVPHSIGRFLQWTTLVRGDNHYQSVITQLSNEMLLKADLKSSKSRKQQWKWKWKCPFEVWQSSGYLLQWKLRVSGKYQDKGDRVC